ncbi:MAG: Gfo/Idh/MocA family oxidoreductase [Trichodesmium sp. MO_231.B1]|nr:Gfo/Idh/MocA family oxidoreductase [Trichodesmium sp. MO_231.B1]
MPEQPRPIVIIGAGGIVSDAHLPAYQIAGFKVAGIIDIKQEKAASLAQKFSIPNVYASVEQAVTQAPANAVFDIAVPASALLELLPKFPRGAGILIQKPMGEDLAQARQLLSICREREYTAAVNFQLRTAPPVIAARHLIEEGCRGNLLDIEMRVTVDTPWHLWDFFEKCQRVEILYHSIHYIDLIRSFLGDPKGVYAKTVKHPDLMKIASVRTTLMLDYGEFVRATINTNHAHKFGLKHQESYLKFEGTQGAIKIRLGVLMDYPKGTRDEFEVCLLQGEDEAEWQSYEIRGSWFPEAFIGSMSSLMRKLEDPSRSLPTSVEDAFVTMSCVEAAYQSSEGGGVPVYGSQNSKVKIQK